MERRDDFHELGCYSFSSPPPTSLSSPTPTVTVGQCDGHGPHLSHGRGSGRDVYIYIYITTQTMADTVCTRVSEGEEYVLQGMFDCTTCGLEGEFGVCALCAGSCHRTHTVVAQTKRVRAMCGCVDAGMCTIQEPQETQREVGGDLDQPSNLGGLGPDDARLCAQLVAQHPQEGDAVLFDMASVMAALLDMRRAGAPVTITTLEAKVRAKADAATAASTTSSSPTSPGAAGEEDNECVVCLDGPKEYACVPCGHKVLCAECQGMGLETCPVCRTEITLIMKVF